MESFDYAYFPRGSRGFKVALSDARDKAVINQEGYYVAPGLKRLVQTLVVGIELYGMLRPFGLRCDKGCIWASFSLPKCSRL